MINGPEEGRWDDFTTSSSVIKSKFHGIEQIIKRRVAVTKGKSITSLRVRDEPSLGTGEGEALVAGPVEEAAFLHVPGDLPLGHLEHLGRVGGEGLDVE